MAQACPSLRNSAWVRATQMPAHLDAFFLSFVYGLRKNVRPLLLGVGLRFSGATCLCPGDSAREQR